MRNSAVENVQEHSHMVAVIAHALAVIRRDVFHGEADPGLTAAAALFHDASEIFTGDLPTPIKYYNPDIMTAYKKVESVAAAKLLTALPREMRPEYERLLSTESRASAESNESGASAASLDDSVHSFVKAADKLAAYVKCLEELKAGNNEFRLAAQQSLEKLEKLEMPEVNYFIEHFIPSFKLTLDELDFSIE